MSVEFGQPLGIAHVGLAAGDLLDVSSIDDCRLGEWLEQVIQMHPIDAGRFHDNIGDLLLPDPIPERFEIFRHGLKLPVQSERFGIRALVHA
ncbi:MAG: hypothetical protein ABI837_13500 [Acidobacteriota bacterium]